MTESALVIELHAHECECAECGARIFLRESRHLPMYEGEVVPDNWEGEWAGFPFCKDCYSKHRED